MSTDWGDNMQWQQLYFDSDNHIRMYGTKCLAPGGDFLWDPGKIWIGDCNNTLAQKFITEQIAPPCPSGAATCTVDFENLSAGVYTKFRIKTMARTTDQYITYNWWNGYYEHKALNTTDQNQIFMVKPERRGQVMQATSSTEYQYFSEGRRIVVSGSAVYA